MTSLTCQTLLLPSITSIRPLRSNTSDYMVNVLCYKPGHGRNLTYRSLNLDFVHVGGVLSHSLDTILFAAISHRHNGITSLFSRLIETHLSYTRLLILRRFRELLHGLTRTSKSSSPFFLSLFAPDTTSGYFKNFFAPHAR
jgi:hypothetical protein